MRELAVDFGTSNTVAAVRGGPDAPVRLLGVDGRQSLSSAVWLSPDGTLIVGRDAERQARLDPSRYEPNPKRRIDDVEVLLGDTVVPVVELIAAVLRRVAEEARRQLGASPDLVLLTHPADWHRIRCNTLRSAARAAGWTDSVRLIAEPTAAAAHFAGLPDVRHRPAPGRALAVFDMGGGTTDAALVLHTDEGGWQILAEAGLPDVGGTDIDHLLLDHVRRSVGHDRPEWPELLRPTTAASRRAARAMIDDVREGKEALSRYAQTDIPLPAPLPDAHVTREELTALVRPQLERAVAMLASTIRGAALPPDRLAGVYLVGGASRMPSVAQLISERLGLIPMVVESPESSVVVGALAAPPARDFTDPRERTPAGARPVGGHGPAPAGAALPAAVLTGSAAVSPPGQYDRVGERPPTGGFGAPSRPPSSPAPPGPFPGGAAVPRVPDGPTHVMSAPKGDRSAPTTPRTVLVTLAAVAVVTSAAVGLWWWNSPDGRATGGEPTNGTGDRQAGASTGQPSGDPSAPDSTPTPGGDPAAAAFGDADELREFAGVAVERADACTDVSDGRTYSFMVDVAVRCDYATADGDFEAYFYDGSACDLLFSPLLGTSGEAGEWSGAGMSGDWVSQRVPTDGSEHLLYRPADGGTRCGEATHAEGDPRSADEVRAFWESTTRPGS
ncbi:actin-like ATPase involved in cell morphogenesis [Actinoalloteichus hoggarensis]|uniref:Chaperone protein DnaK n=1 Tax=Actinoalloteichus hoggarensis TaxID=1470176 RepID=A0A221WAJ8_9PSEU|nr:Hsp70 family protein [Actinoalloteichus hoggarensis]ASO23060.1 Chaperone protein DnaK [Actinoalloteichus hoggarensis]MBB5922665.1 actin-like ATPase involved in cell morphogenesis [Actinoalloteichus hoggarensis]